MAATVRIEPAAHAALSQIARAKQVSLTEALSRAVEAYRREVFLEGVALDFAALRADPEAWAEEAAEREEWERTTADGLADEPRHVDASQGARRPAKRAKPRRAGGRGG